jgi:VCBS repeat protein
MRGSRTRSYAFAAVLVAAALLFGAAETTFKIGIATNFLSDAAGWGNEIYYASIAYADVNGDGKPDLCARGPSGIFCALGDGTGNFATGSLINGPVWSDAAGWNQPYRYRTVKFPDLNGDGKADVCGRDMNGVVCHLSTGSGFSSTAIRGPGLPDAGGWVQERYYSTIQFPDVNGDGKADCCYRGSGGIYCLEFASTAFSTTYKPGPSEFLHSSWDDVTLRYWSTIQFSDLNGDGLADVCGRGGGGGTTGSNPSATGVRCWLKITSGWGSAIVGPAWSDVNGWGADKHSSTIRYADVSGDGKADVCARSYQSVGCFLFNGTGFNSTGIDGPAWGDPNGWYDPKYYSTIAFPDINGDWKADVCARDSAGITCAVSTGQGFLPPYVMDVNPAPSDAAGWGYPQYYATMRWVDFNGDVRKDLAIRGSAGVYVHLQTSTCDSATAPAMFISETPPPATMTPGQQVNVNVTYLNCSGSTWTAATSVGAATGVKLGSQWPQDNNVWGASRVLLPASVPVGGEVTIRFTARAPTTAGTYNYQWGIVDEGVAWLQDFTPPRRIQVNAPLICGGVTCALGQVCDPNGACCTPKKVYCNGACGSTVDNGCGQRFKCDECKYEWDNSNWTAGTCVDAAGNFITPTNLVPAQLYGLPGGQGNPQGQKLFVKPGGFPPLQYDGLDVPDFGNHIQGVQRLSGGAPYVLLTGDGKINGHLFAARFPTKSGFDRWGGIVNGPDSADIVTGQGMYVISPSNYKHAGGLSVFGKFAAVPLQRDDECHGQIAFFDLRTPPTSSFQPAWKLPTVLEMITPKNDELLPGGVWTHYTSAGCLIDVNGQKYNLASGAVAIVKSNGSFLIVVEGDRSSLGSLRFYRSTSDNILEPQSFTYLGRLWKINGQDISRYNNVNFVRQCDGKLYLFGTFQDGTGGVFGKNRVHVYEVQESTMPLPTLTLIANFVLDEHSGGYFESDEYAKFGAGAGVYVTKSGKVVLYGTQYYHNKEGFGQDPATQPLRMMEY